jgi:hypothetical protein
MKKGCIKIQKHIYEKDWNLVSHIFREFRPYHMEYDHVKEVWTFTGTHDSFDEVAEHEPAPQYLVTIKASPGTCTGNTADGLHISFERAEPAQHAGPGLMTLAMQIIKDELKKDQSEGSYYHTWGVSLEDAIMDAFAFTNCETTPIDIAHAAAERFLNNLINSK